MATKIPGERKLGLLSKRGDTQRSLSGQNASSRRSFLGRVYDAFGGLLEGEPETVVMVKDAFGTPLLVKEQERAANGQFGPGNVSTPDSARAVLASRGFTKTHESQSPDGRKDGSYAPGGDRHMITTEHYSHPSGAVAQIHTSPPGNRGYANGYTQVTAARSQRAHDGNNFSSHGVGSGKNRVLVDKVDRAVAVASRGKAGKSVDLGKGPEDAKAFILEIFKDTPNPTSEQIESAYEKFKSARTGETGRFVPGEKYGLDPRVVGGDSHEPDEMHHHGEGERHAHGPMPVGHMHTDATGVPWSHPSTRSGSA